MISFSTSTVNPNTFGKPVTEDLHEGAAEYNSSLDLDGKLQEENFGQNINENVGIADVSQRLTPIPDEQPVEAVKPVKAPKEKK